MDELRTALELATEEELQELTEVLFRPRFNPLDYLHAPDPAEVQSQDHALWLDTLEQRVRFLAADGVTVLRGQTDQVTYRQILLRICRYLKLNHLAHLSTTDLEAEIFLSLLNRAWKQLPQSQQQALTQQVQDSLQNSVASQPLLATALQHDPVRLLLEGGSALALSSWVRPILLQQVAEHFALHFAAYQAAKQTAVGGTAALQTQLALQSARQGMALSATRYAATRSAFAVLGSVLWVWFFADLGWRAIATNYSRVIPIVFALAQIRLTRSVCFDPA